jgi:hypothetical protein
MMDWVRARWYVRGALALLTVLSLAYFARALVDIVQADALLWPRTAAWPWVAFSLVLGVLHCAACGLLFAWLIGRSPGGRIESVYLAAQLGKYMPGRVWSVVAQKALLGADAGVFGVLGANVVLAAIVVASQLAAVLGSAAWLAGHRVLALSVAAGTCMLAGIGASMLRRVGQRTGWRILACWSLPHIGVLAAGGALVAMLLTGAAWLALFHGALGYAMDAALALQAVSSASFLAGLLSVLPAGLGMREGAFVALGLDTWPLPHATMPALALLTRAWLLAVDALAIIVGFCGLWWRRRHVA